VATGTGLLAHWTLAAKWDERKGGYAPQPVAQGVESPRPEQPRQVRIDPYGDPLPPGALARIGTIRLPHPGHAAPAFSTDGKTVISASPESIHFWDVATGKPLPRKTSEPLGGGTFTLAPDGKTFVTRRQSELQFWDVDQAKELRRIPVGRVYTTA